MTTTNQDHLRIEFFRAVNDVITLREELKQMPKPKKIVGDQQVFADFVVAQLERTERRTDTVERALIALAAHLDASVSK